MYSILREDEIDFLYNLCQSTILSIFKVLDNDPSSYMDKYLKIRFKMDSEFQSDTKALPSMGRNKFDKEKVDDLINKLPFSTLQSADDYSLDLLSAVPGIRTFVKSGDAFQLEGDHTEALDRYREALVLLHDSGRDYCEKNPESAKTFESQLLMKVASELFALNHFDEALGSFLESVPHLHEVKGVEDETVIYSHFKMGLLHVMMESESECAIEKSLVSHNNYEIKSGTDLITKYHI